jgi:hypothetical protein
LEGSQAVLLVKDLINFGFKDVGAAVVSGMESDFGRAIYYGEKF